ncbi:MAG TPA: hypothetical protein VFY04_02035 [Solirubrobacterales bacterium]|nr:hypothetical protein [Solirubrobacterales bacterium]
MEEGHDKEDGPRDDGQSAEQARDGNAPAATRNGHRNNAERSEEDFGSEQGHEVPDNARIVRLRDPTS